VTRALAAAPLLVGAALAGVAWAAAPAAAHYAAGPIAFDYPSGWTTEAVADVSAETAVRLVAPAERGRPPRLKWALVLAGSKKVGESELDAESAAWHAAHVRNRSAWGMRSAGGPPRDTVRVAGRRGVRYRDRVDSALGASEQTLTCSVIAARLTCVTVAASPDARELSDGLASLLLGTLQLKRR
jgi:hypothetical protein